MNNIFDKLKAYSDSDYSRLTGGHDFTLIKMKQYLEESMAIPEKIYETNGAGRS